MSSINTTLIRICFHTQNPQKHTCISGKPNGNPNKTADHRINIVKNVLRLVYTISIIRFRPQLYHKLVHSANEYRKHIPGRSSLKSRKVQRNHGIIPHYCFSFVHICISLTQHEHASRIQQASLVWRQNTAATHEHTHCTTTEQDNRLMRPKTDSTNDPTKITNTKNTEDTSSYSYTKQAHIMCRYTSNLNVGFCCLSVGP